MVLDDGYYYVIEKRNKLIWDNIDDLITVIEPNHEYNIVYINEDALKQILGYNKKNLIGKSLKEYIYPDDKEKFKELLLDPPIKNQKNELRLLTKNKGYVWVELKAFSLKESKNQQNIFVKFKDISTQKELELRLEDYKEKIGKISNLIPSFRFWNLFTPKKYDEALHYSYDMLHLITENIPLYIFWKDSNLVYSGCNSNYAKFIGTFTPEDIIGRTDKKLLRINRNFKKTERIEKYVLKTGIPILNQIERWEIESNDDIWLNTCRIPLCDSKGKVIGILITYEDITNRKKEEHMLIESEAKYHDLFETSPNGVMLIDLKGNILECNSALEAISGYPTEDFIGKNVFQLKIFYKNGLEILLNSFKDLMNKNQLELVEFQILKKDNKISWIQIRAKLIIRKGVTLVLVVINDINTQKTIEQALKENEKIYRQLFDTSTVGIMEMDLKDNKVSNINPKLLNILGYSREDLKDEDLRLKIIHPEDLHKLILPTQEEVLEFRIFNKDGKLKWLAGTRKNHFDDNGKISSLTLWLEDVTEKKMYEELIHELNINFLNFTTDIRNNIIMLLNSCLKLLNADLVLYIHKLFDDGKDKYQILTNDNKSFVYNSQDFTENIFSGSLFYEEHDFPQTFFDIHKMGYAKTDPFISEYNLKGSFGKLIKTKDATNSAICVFFKTNPSISNQDKLVMFLICDAIEIEQRRWQVQNDLEEQNITLNKMNNLKTELFSRTSHELKTPLISIKGFTELLLTIHRAKLDDDMISILEEIKNGSKRLEKIIKLLLEGTKLEAGQYELNRTEEDLTFLIKFCVNELKGLVRLRNQTITLELHDELKTKFDKERIYDVISNLLVNAIKYTQLEGNILIQSEIKDSLFIISIKDNGIGFTSEEKSQVFKQFGRIERYGQGWDVDIEGTGLGLYITKKIIEIHGGKIWLESAGRNKGSSFYFSIPIIE